MSRNIYTAILWLAAGLLACQTLRVAEATTIYVATNGMDSRTGQTDWTNAVLTISNGVAKATTANDLVLVSNGEYIVTTQINVSIPITIRSWNNGIVDPTNTIVNGNAATRCLYMSGTGAVVEGFTIYNGSNASVLGGGVSVANGTLRNCLVISNYGGTGGGVYLSGSVTGCVDNCLIAYNVSTGGGGGVYSGSARLVTNCVIRNNQAVGVAADQEGGGALIWSSAILANSLVYSNESFFGGGGIYTYGGVVKNCVISNNVTSGSGGGIKMKADAIITNCVIITNIAGGDGGGIFMMYNGTIANCRIIGNRATNPAANSYSAGGVTIIDDGTILNSEIRDNFTMKNGGGLSVNYGNWLYLRARLRNCLIAGNVSSNGGGVYLRGSNNVLENCTIVSNRSLNTVGGLSMATGTNFFVNCIIYYNTASSGTDSNYVPNNANSFSNSCLAPAPIGPSTNYSANNITVDPQFVNKDTGNWRLKAGSPGVNSGANRDWMTNALDLDGRPRLRYGTVDMGAYERIYNGTIFCAH